MKRRRGLTLYRQTPGCPGTPQVVTETPAHLVCDACKGERFATAPWVAAPVRFTRTDRRYLRSINIDPEDEPPAA